MEFQGLCGSDGKDFRHGCFFQFRFFGLTSQPLKTLTLGLVILSLILSSSCGFVPFYALGKKFDPALTAELVKGKSTRDDVLSLFGAPTESSTSDLKRAKWWRYSYTYLGNTEVERARLEIDFKGDRVEDYKLEVTESRY
jgi:outer membrane protein assembly factor BamE (lipoprotein component of BamABCDE complex)